MANSQSSGMLSRDQLLYLFDRFAYLTSQPDVKNRIAEAVMDKQEAVAVTTAIQEEIFLEMGVDPGFGIGCLGKVNMVYENDRDLMICFYGFVAKLVSTITNCFLKVLSCLLSLRSPDCREEMACDEAELGSEEFAEKMQFQHQLQEQQLEMLKHMRKFPLDDQSFILEKLHEKMQDSNFDNWVSVMSSEQIEEAIRDKAVASSKSR